MKVNRRVLSGFTIIEVMFTLAFLGVGLLFFLYIFHSISAAQVEIRDRLREMAAAEAIAEKIIAYTGSNASLKTVFASNPDVRIEDESVEIVKVVVTRTFSSIIRPEDILSVQLTFLRYCP